MKTQRVAIGIVTNELDQLLLSKRADTKHLAGAWEFPGGKVASQESFKMALRRELFEEIGIHTTRTRKIIEFNHQYDDCYIHFQVYKVIQYLNKISAKEGQPIRWVNLKELDEVQFPAANNVIVDTLRLPSLYMIADQQCTKDNVLSNIQQQLKNGIRLVQYRAHRLTRSEYITTAKSIRELCEQYNATMICNCDLDWVDTITPHGVHLSSTRLREVYKNSSSSNANNFFSASCHSKHEIELANQLGVRSILIGPVHYTASHPNAISLEWEGFNQLCNNSNVPVYALGGISKDQVPLAIAHGAQGIAGISTFCQS